MPTCRWTLVSLLLAFSLTGCASSLRQADQAFETGAYLEAAAAYESHLHDEPAAKHRDHVLFRLALAYAVAEEPFRNPDSARALLQELVLRHPTSPYRAQALLILHLGEDAERQRDASAERKATTEKVTRDALRLFEELELLREERQTQEAQLGEQAKEAERLRRALDRLRRAVASRDAEIARLAHKLEELKRIDAQKIAGRIDG